MCTWGMACKSMKASPRDQAAGPFLADSEAYKIKHRPFLFRNVQRLVFHHPSRRGLHHIAYKGIKTVSS